MGNGATDSLEYAQRINLETFVRSALVDYFETRQQREANEAAYVKLETKLADQTERMNEIFRSIESGIHSYINLGFIALEKELSLLTRLSTEQIIDEYKEHPDKLRFNVSVRERTYFEICIPWTDICSRSVLDDSTYNKDVQISVDKTLKANLD